jgi:hypothetical protein
MNKLDKYTDSLVDIFTSRTIIIVIMLLFMGGIVVHMHAVFESWLLAISAQFTIVLLTINAKYLPSIKTKIGIDLPLLTFVIAIFMVWFIYTNLQTEHPCEVLELRWILNITEALFFAVLEMSFSFLFVARLHTNIGDPIDDIASNDTTKNTDFKPDDKPEIDGLIDYK